MNSGFFLMYNKNMNFADVEGLRQACLTKRNKVRKKTVMITLSAYFVLVVLAIFSNRELLANSISVVGDTSPSGVMLVVMPIIFMLVISIVNLVVIISVVVSLSVRKNYEKYKKAYKAYFVEEQLGRYFTDIKYDHTAGLDREILRRTGMVYTGDRYSSNDLTIGRYKNVGFTQADVHIERAHTDKNGNKSYSTVFLGRYMVFEFPKRFSSRLMLSHSNSPTRKKSEDNSRTLTMIKTESVDFDKTFVTYAEDGMEALYILTPDFMERVQKLSQEHNNQVSFYFYDNMMIIGVNDGNDIFEAPSFERPIDEKTEMQRVNGEMALIINIIDGLKLDRKIHE